eukprot:s2492_g2.t1
MGPFLRIGPLYSETPKSCLARQRDEAEMRACCRRCRQRSWACLPATWQEYLESCLGKIKFAVVCTKWAATFFWEDRHELIADVKSALMEDVFRGAGASPAPRSKKEVEAELQPFRLALMAAVLYCSWDMIAKAARSLVVVVDPVPR